MLDRYTYLENISASSTAMIAMTWRRGTADLTVPAAALRRVIPCALYQWTTWNSTNMPSSAVSENHATLDWPYGSTMKAASSGPAEVPKLPPTWNTDCASPCLPPEAMRATREDSGWNTEEPVPMRAAANSSSAKLPANASSTSPTRVNPMPAASE